MPDLREVSLERIMPDLHGVPFDGNETYFSLSNYDSKDIGTVSFDLRLGGLVARCDTVFNGISEADIRRMEHQVLEPGQPFEFKYDSDGRNVYYFVSFEELKHSSDILVDVHAKSTTGRLGCHVNGVGRTREGKLITLLQPLAFNLIAKSGRLLFLRGL